MSAKDRKTLGLIVGAAGVVMAAKSLAKHDTPGTQASFVVALLGFLLSL
jgi:hypothetical protein